MTKNLNGRSQLFLLFLLITCPPLWGCRSLGPPRPVEQYLIEGFENCGLWSLDSANNYGTVSYSSTDATEGQYSLAVTFQDDGRENTIFRKEVDYNLALTERLWLDVLDLNPGEGVQCALAFRTAGERFFETRPVSLRRGWNLDVEFNLSTGMKTGTDLTAWAGQRSAVNRLMLLVYPGQNKKGALSFDRLRAARPGVNRLPRPVLLDAQSPAATVEQWQVQELTLEFAADSLWQGTNRWGTDTWFPVEILARLTDPKGRSREIKGFLKEVTPKKPQKLIYAIRFLPTTPGRWHLGLAYKAERRWHTVCDSFFMVEANSASAEPVAVDAGDPSYLRLVSGRFFYPIGQNVCWAGSYEPYLDSIRDYGGNLVRIWICPWNFPLLDRNLEEINLSAAAGLDRVMQLAFERRIHVQLVIAYHGWFTADWERNPFNAVLGGPCPTPEEFWSNTQARQAFKNYLDQIVRRWSAWPNLFAWELFNEADLVPRNYEDEVTEWHEEMGEYVRQNDPYDHIVTTSTSSAWTLQDIWALPAIGLVTSHIYTPDLAREIPATWRLLGGYGKPYFIAEIGRGTNPADDQVDPEGVHLHHALWLSAMTPTAGTCLPWWWDTHIEPNLLSRHFHALLKFMANEDRGGLALKRWSTEFTTSTNTQVEIHGLVGKDRIYGFVFNPKAIEELPPRLPLPLLPTACRLTFPEMEEGTYRLEIWNTYTGEITEESELRCTNQRLGIELPPTPQDFAFKVRRTKL